MMMFIAISITFFSCETTCNLELPKQEKQQGKDKVRVTVNVVELDENGNEVLATRAVDNAVVTGAGYHQDQYYTVTVKANYGYALVELKNQTENKVITKNLLYMLQPKEHKLKRMWFTKLFSLLKGLFVESLIS